MRAGEVQPEVGRPPEDGGGGGQAPGEQRLEHLAPLGLLPPREVVAGELEPLAQGGDAVVGGAQDRQGGGADLLRGPGREAKEAADRVEDNEGLGLRHRETDQHGTFEPSGDDRNAGENPSQGRDAGAPGEASER